MLREKRAVLFLCAKARHYAPISSADKAGEVMRIRVSDGIRQAGDPFEFEVSERFVSQTYGERVVAFSEPISVAGTYVYDGKAFTVSARAEAAVEAVCARCTKPFVERVSFRFSERFVKGEEFSPEDETYPYTGDELVLDKAVLDNLFLELPIASVCREDCKGLCPVCGADRNTTACNCTIEEA
jgi:uncharacterized protein